VQVPCTFCLIVSDRADELLQRQPFEQFKTI
jgi:hypothetical protein